MQIYTPGQSFSQFFFTKGKRLLSFHGFMILMSFEKNIPIFIPNEILLHNTSKNDFFLTSKELCSWTSRASMDPQPPCPTPGAASWAAGCRACRPLSRGPRGWERNLATRYFVTRLCPRRPRAVCLCPGRPRGAS